MFGNTAVLEKPVAQKVQAQESLDEYVAVANKLGVKSPALVTNAFLAFMAKADLPIYNLPTVVAYMDKMAEKDGTGEGWLWRPMRAQDGASFQRGERFGWGTKARPGLFKKFHGSSDWYESGHDIGVYAHAIPLRVLQRAQKIQDGSPVQGKFFVSDYATKLDKQLKPLPPDPFLMFYVMSTNERYVVDFWDEPGFGLKEMLA